MRNMLACHWCRPLSHRTPTKEAAASPGDLAFSFEGDFFLGRKLAFFDCPPGFGGSLAAFASAAAEFKRGFDGAIAPPLKVIWTAPVIARRTLVVASVGVSEVSQERERVGGRILSVFEVL